MTWFRVDDKLHEHPKVRKLRKDRLPALGLWTACGAWAADNLSDGFVPAEVVTRYDPDEGLARRLVEVGLWDVAEEDGEEGYRFHQWAEHQPSREEVLQKRASGRARVAAFRQRKAAERAAAADEEKVPGNEVGNALQGADVTPLVTPPPTRPDPTPLTTSSPGADAPEEESGQDAPGQRDDVEQLCSRLVDRMVANGCKPPTITKRWRQQARLLLDRDGRDLTKALNLLDWSQSDPFWSTNVHSLPTFREKYDQLQMKARDDWHRQQRRAPLPPDPAVTGKRRLSL